MSNNDDGHDFARSAKQRQSGIWVEVWEYLRQNKKWWLTPIILALLLVGILVVVGGSSLAPFIYTLF